MPERKFLLFKTCVWLARIVVGLTFVVSGWAKAVDPWGFIYKIEDYLTVWSIDVAREITLTGAISLSVAEFITGVLIVTGCWRRLSVMVAAGFMAVMLPLTAYIAIADPVPDCGCFGDFIIISNTATFLKNIVLSALVIYLLKYNTRVKGLYRHSLQWQTVAVSLVFVVTVSFIGYRYQPVVDFRPFKTGSVFPPASAEDDPNVTFVYSKDGEEREYDIDNLPDSTWTFVSRIDRTGATDDNSFAVFDGYDDVTGLLVSDKPLLLLVVNDPGAGYLYRSRLAMQFAALIEREGGEMVAILAADADGVEKWRNLAAIDTDIFTADDTSLKMLARGDTALVYIVDGHIVWKRNIASFSPDLFDCANENVSLTEMSAVDDGGVNLRLSLLWIIAMVLIYLFNFSRKTKNVTERTE